MEPAADEACAADDAVETAADEAAGEAADDAMEPAGVTATQEECVHPCKIRKVSGTQKSHLL